MTKKELIAALEKYADEDEIYLLCETIKGVDEEGEDLTLYPGICMIKDGEIDYLGEALRVLPEESEYTYYGTGGMA